MKSVTINDLEIRYDDSISDAYLKKVLTLIERYYEILIDSFKEMNDGNSNCIISLVPTEEEKVFYFEDFFAAFNNFMEKTLRDIFKYYYVSGRYEGILPRYLEEYFNQEAKKKKINLLLKLNTGNINEKPVYFWLVVMVSYFAEQCMGDSLKQEEECIDRCLDYINSSSGKATNEIFNWLLSKYGLDLYDSCLGDFLKLLSARGLPNNILEIVLAEYENMFNRLIALGIKDDNEADDLENVDIDINKLFLEFLASINAPSEWYDYYYGLLETGALTFKIVKAKHAGIKKQDEEGEQRVNTACVNFKPIIKNGKLQVEDISNIKIQVANKADAFIILVHEFIHYVNWKKLLDKVNAHLLLFSPRYGVFGKDEYKHAQDVVNMLWLQRVTTNEFPSIFFEKIATSFLACKFSCKASVTSLFAFRTFDELKNYIVFFYVWLDLKRRKEFVGIEEDTEFKPFDLNVSREKLNKILDEIDFNGWQDKVGIKRIPFYVRRNCSREDYGGEFEGVNNDVYKRLKDVIFRGEKIVEYLYYALGNFLAEYLTEQLDRDPTIVERMVRCVDEGTLSLDDITREFDLYKLFGQVPPGFEKN